MSSKVFIYNDDIPFSRMCKYVYSNNAEKCFAEITRGTQFATVKDQGIYTIYRIDAEGSVYVFNCNKRDLDNLLRKSSPVCTTIEEQHAETVAQLKFHIYNIINHLEKRAVNLFYKGKDAINFNRSLMKMDRELYFSVRDLATGAIPKHFRDEIAIASSTKTLLAFKHTIKDIRSSVHLKQADLKAYERKQSEYLAVFRYVSPKVA
jgi:hypothetical protein